MRFAGAVRIVPVDSMEVAGVVTLAGASTAGAGVVAAAWRALLATDGEVRTSVPVSERWMAFWLASAAVRSEVPTPVGDEEIGAVLGVVV